MQGLEEFIPTEQKAEYINLLLKAGFDTIDFGSFVNPKAIPQMKDTANVLGKLDLSQSKTRLLAIIANQRGAEDACQFDEISYLGFPFSISETFQQRNTNSSITESLGRVKDIQELCKKHNKELVVYISMAFGNPYGDPWSAEVALEWADKLHNEVSVNILALADTIGTSGPENIEHLFSALIPAYRDVEFGAHLHTTPNTWKEKVEAAWKSGCRRFDGAIKGFGGCPMADDELTGNMPMENMIGYFRENNIEMGIDSDMFNECMLAAQRVFPI